MQSKIRGVKFMQNSAIPLQGEESIIEVCNTRSLQSEIQRKHLAIVFLRFLPPGASN
jgi:hypothetical protein